MPINISGETKIPNWMLGLFILGLTGGWGIIGGVIIQDRGRVYGNAEAIGKERAERIETDAQFARDMAVNRKDLDNLMSMWAQVKKDRDEDRALMVEMNRKLERLMP